MTDAMFTFGWYALAIGAATGRFPAPGELRLVGSSPRYRLYPTRDGKLVACGALEQKFWEAFTAAIGLPADLADDARSPSTTLGAVAERIAQRTADDWRPILTAAECCATIVTPLEEAMRDPHFVARGLFAHEVEMSEGSVLPALPVPIAPAFRGRPGTKRAP
jgi:alpha-methylacyl-CoA racemase